MPTDHTPDTDEDASEVCRHDGARAGARFCSSCGAAIAAPDPVAPVEPTPRAGIPHRAPGVRRRLPRRVVVPVAAGAVLVLAAVGALYLVQGQRYSPEQPAEELAAALEAGDGPAVAAILGVEATDHPMLAAGALDTGYEAPTGVEVTGVEYDTAGQWEGTGDGTSVRWVEDYTRRPDMDHATVTLAYSLGGEAYTVDLDATREGTGWARPWSLNPAPLETTVRTSATREGAVQLAAASVDQTADTTQWDAEDDAPGLLVLPGVYTATAAGDGLWSDAQTTVAVPLGEDVAAVLSADIRPDAEAAVTAAVVAHIDACAAAGGYPDASCGWREDTGWMTIMPADTPWSVETYPAVEVAPDYTGGVEVTTVTPGTAVAKYETAAGETRTITADVHANGTAAPGDDGAPVYTPQPCDVGASYC